MPRNSYFFFHIPKTAGTSFKRILERVFTHVRDAELSREQAALLSRERPSATCISGHFAGRLFGVPGALLEKYPHVSGNPSERVICLVRDPLEHAVSYYLHDRRRGGLESAGMSLESFLDQPHNLLQSRCLGITDRNVFPDALSSMWMWGLADDLALTVNALSERLGVGFGEPPRLNAASAWERPAIPAGVRSRFQRKFELDYELYERVRDSVIAPSRARIDWDGTQQFLYGMAADLSGEITTLRFCESGGPPSGQQSSIHAIRLHGRDGATKARFESDEDVGVTLTFFINAGDEGAEPALVVERDGAVAFSAAFTPDAGVSLRVGARVSATAWIPGNLLNVGLFSLGASLSIPSPVRRLHALHRALEFRVEEPSRPTRSAAGNWATPFPGAVRPLLDWTIRVEK